MDILSLKFMKNGLDLILFNIGKNGGRYHILLKRVLYQNKWI